MQELGLKAQGTQRGYLRHFNSFMKRWNLTPSELYEMRLSDSKSDDPRDAKRIERMVMTQMNEIIEEGWSSQKAVQFRNAVSSFFEAQGMPLQWRKKDRPKGESNGSRVALVSHIKSMYDNAGHYLKQRNRAILFALKDSGLRISDLCTLTVGYYRDLIPMKNEHGEVFKVFLEPTQTVKMKINAYVHLGPEAVTEIDRYLEEREESGERLTPEAPLFLNNDDGPLTERAIKNVFDRWKKWLDKRGQKVSAHSLRKFHRTRLEGAGMAEGWVKRLQGKSASVYSHPEQTGELTKAYMSSYDRLRVFGQTVPVERIEEQAEEIEKLRRVNEELRQQMENRVTREELEELKETQKRDSELLGLLLEAAKENPELIDKLLKKNN